MKSKVVAKAEMLIRKPVAEVFAAFVDPAITSKFWFTKGSGKLEPGKTVKWDWEMYNVSADVSVTTVEPNKRIVVDWSTHGASTTIEWTFALCLITPPLSALVIVALAEMTMKFSNRWWRLRKDLRSCWPR
jgi:uncharacterized protein YndB with AHSA1/START domain